MVRIRERCIAALAVRPLVAVAAKARGEAPVRSGCAAGPRLHLLDDLEVMIGWDPATGYSNEVIAMHNIYENADPVRPVDPGGRAAAGRVLGALGRRPTWTFTLRDGVTFHSGRALNAEAAKAAIERTMEIGEGAAYIWGAVKRIQRRTTRRSCSSCKYPSPLDLVASGTYSAYIYDTKAAGGGPRRVVRRGERCRHRPVHGRQCNQGEEIELALEAYPDYWGGWDGDHYERYVFRVTPEATTAAQLLRAGEVTLVQRMSPQLWASFEGQDGRHRRRPPRRGRPCSRMLNTSDGPLADDRVREAIAYGVDYAGIIQALQGAADPLLGVVPPGLWGHSDDLSGYEYDQTFASELLEEAGYGPDGEQLTLELTYLKGDADEETVATLMKSNLAALNVDLQVRGYAVADAVGQGKSADPTERQDIFLFYWWPDYADPISWFFNLFRTEQAPFFNLSYYSNPALDAQIDEASAVAATDREAASQMYVRMQETLYEDDPALPLYTQVYQRAMLDSVQGFVDDPAYPNVVFGYELTPAA